MPTTPIYGWSTPAAVDANDVPLVLATLASQVEGDLDDLADSIAADWPTYAVAWSGPSTLVVGDGTLNAWWVKRGRTIHVICMLVRGSTTNLGSGSYSWTLPENAADYRMVTGAGYVLRGSTWHPATVCGIGSGAVGLIIPTGRVGSAVPGSWASGDIIMWQATYRSGS